MDTRWLDPDEQAAWRAFLSATQLLFDQLDRELQRDARIPHTYYEILVRLSEAPETRLRMSELAQHSLSSRSRLSHAVTRLEEAGWVRRELCPSDGRGSYAVLTPAGSDALTAAAPGHVRAVRQYLIDRLSREQVAQLTEISNRIRSGLGAEDDVLGQSSPS